MHLHENINMIQTRENFIEFLYLMVKDKELNSEEWENKSITEYFEGMASWVEDMDGYYNNMNLQMPRDIDWKFIATLLYVGKIYE